MTTHPASLRGRLLMITMSLVLYIAAFALPALRFTYNNGEVRIMDGLDVALLGWAALLVYNFGWLANAVYLSGLFLFLLGLWTPALAFGITALLIALQSLMLFGVTLYADGAGVLTMSLTGVEAGFYAWGGAIATLVFMTVLGHRARPRQVSVAVRTRR